MFLVAGVPATALEAGLMLLTEWASNLTHGTSFNQPASEDSYHERSLPRLRGEDHSDHHNPVPLPHRAEAQYDDSYHPSFRQDAARNFVGHGHIPVMPDHHRVGCGHVLDTPQAYDGGREEKYVSHRREDPRVEVDYDGQFGNHYASDEYADDRVDFRSSGHAQQGLSTRSNAKRHSIGLEEGYGFGRYCHASEDVGDFVGRHDSRHHHVSGSGFDGRRRHGSDIGFDNRHRHASDMGFDHDNSYHSSDQEYPPPYHHEHGDSSGPVDSHTPFEPEFYPNDQPMKYSQRKRSYSDIDYKRKSDFPPKRSRLETHNDRPSMLGSQHSTGPHGLKHVSSTSAPKRPLLNRLGPCSTEGRDSGYDFIEDKDLNVPPRLGPSPIQSRLGPKHDMPPLLPDLRAKLNGRVNESPIPLLPSPNPLTKPQHKASSKEKPLPDLSVPDFLKPGSSGSPKIHSIPANKTASKSPGGVPATGQNRSKGPPVTVPLKTPGLQPAKPPLKEGVVSKPPAVTSQKKNVKVVKVVQKSSPKDPSRAEVPVTVEGHVPSRSAPPPETSVEASTTESGHNKHPIHISSDASRQQPLPLLGPIITDSKLKESGHQPSRVSDPRLKGHQQSSPLQPLQTKLSDPRLKGSQHQSSPLLYHQQRHSGVEKSSHVSAPSKQQPLLPPQQQQQHSRPESSEQRLLPPQQQQADPVLGEQRQIGIDHISQQQQQQIVSRRPSTTTVVSNVVEDSDSGKESDDCGLVIDEEAYLCDSESSEQCEEEASESAVTVNEHPAIRRTAEESSDGHLTVWDSAGSEEEISATVNEKEKQPAGWSGDVRTDRNTLRVAYSMLSRAFVHKLNKEGNLLQKLYDAMKILVRFLNGRDSWHYGFVCHIRKMFRSYCVGSAKSPTKLKDQFRLELKHLHSLCGSNVLLWHEQIQRFSLLALTYPKNKEDKRMESFANSVVVTGIESGKEVIVISSDDEDEESGSKGADKEVPCVVPVKSEPEIRSPELGGSLQPKDGVRAVISQSICPTQPMGSGTATGFDEPGEGSSQVGRSARLGSSVGRSAPTGQVSIADKEGSDGECNMSVCSTLSNNFDEEEGGSQQAKECGPDLRRWFHAQERLVCQQEKSSVEGTDGSDVLRSDRKDAKAVAKTPPQPPGRPPSPDIPPLPPTPPRPPTPESHRAASLSPGELTPTPPPSPKSTGHAASQSSTSASAYDLPNKSRVCASRSSQHLPPRRKAAKPIRSHAYRPTAYRSPPVRSRSKFPRKSRSRSRDRYDHSRRSRSPIMRSRQQRASGSPQGHAQGRGSRRRSLSPSPDRGSGKGKVKQQRKKMEEEDLELLRLKKEVILSIVKKPAAEMLAQATSTVTTTGKNIPPLQSTRVDTTSMPSASKDTSNTSSMVSKGPPSVLPAVVGTSKKTSSLPLASVGTSPLPSTSQSISSLSSSKQKVPSQTLVASSKPTRRGSAPLPISGRDSPSSMHSSLAYSNKSSPSLSKDTPPSIDGKAQVSGMDTDEEHLPASKLSTQSMTSTRGAPTIVLSSDGVLAKKVVTGLAKKAIAKTLECHNLSLSAGAKSPCSSVSSSRISSRVASPIGSPGHVPGGLSTQSSEEAPGRSSSSGSVKPTASVKVHALCNCGGGYSTQVYYTGFQVGKFCFQLHLRTKVFYNLWKAALEVKFKFSDYQPENHNEEIL